jgi:hypothetical protein
MITRSDVEQLLGHRVRVHAPAYLKRVQATRGIPEAPYEIVPESVLHGLVVTLDRLSPTQDEVVRTSGGPLQWSRRRLRLTPEPGVSPCP